MESLDPKFFGAHRDHEPAENWVVDLQGLTTTVHGEIDRIGLPGTKLTFSDATGKQQDSLTIAVRR
jgi:hypothetical protein